MLNLDHTIKLRGEELTDENIGGTLPRIDQYKKIKTENFAYLFKILTEKLRTNLTYDEIINTEGDTPGKLLKDFLFSFSNRENTSRRFEDLVGQGVLDYKESAYCIEDEVRTIKFLNAVKLAATECLKANQHVHLIDAGCGSIPILAIQAAILSPKVTVTAIELNPASVALAREIVENIGLSKQINIVEADATKYVPSKKANIVVSETLDAGLNSERVVQIMSNLANYLDGETSFLLPKSVTIKCGLIPNSQIIGGKKMPTRKFNIPKTDPIWGEAIEYKLGGEIKPIEFKFDLTNPLAENAFLVIGMEVDLGFTKLNQEESCITLPTEVFTENNEALVIPPKKVSISVGYNPGTAPKGNYESVELSAINQRYQEVVKHLDSRSVDLSSYNLKIPIGLQRQIEKLNFKYDSDFINVSPNCLFDTNLKLGHLILLISSKYIYFYMKDDPLFRLEYDLESRKLSNIYFACQPEAFFEFINKHADNSKMLAELSGIKIPTTFNSKKFDTESYSNRLNRESTEYELCQFEND